MRKILVVVLFLIVGASRAQDLGGQLQIDSYFHSVELNGPIQATIHPMAEGATEPRAVVTIEGLKIKEVPCKVTKSCLRINAQRGLFERKGVVKVDIYIQDLRVLRSKGATVQTNGQITSKSLMVETLGAVNKIKLNVRVQNLVVRASGDSDVLIAGQVEGATLKTVFGSRIDMFHCVARNAYATASELSEIYLYVLDRLQAKVTSCATIYYLTPSADPVLAIKKSLWGEVVPILSPEIMVDAR